MDVLGDVAWSQLSVALAQKSSGRWRVKFTRPDRYRFELRRWPRELGLSLGDTLEKEGISKLAPFADAVRSDEGTAWKETGKTKALAPQKAKLEFFGAQFEAEASGGQAGAVFSLPVEQTGETDLSACFVDQNGEETGAYYVYVEWLESL